MKKQQELSGSSALDFVESLEQSNKQLEEWCESTKKIYADYKGRIKPCLVGRISAANNVLQCRTRDNVQNHAWLVASAKFAERLADRYGIELN